MELNFDDLEMQKWNKLTGRAQRVYEKNRIIYLVIIFTLRVMVVLNVELITEKKQSAKYRKNI